jgi:glycosyltransferase involved in cell wall biosynthesis
MYLNYQKNSMSSQLPKFGICLPNRNYGHFLSECIESIQSQSYSNFVVLFCDGGSTDNSVDLFRTLTSEDCRFSIYSLSDNGQADAIHQCFLHLRDKADILYYLNSDDILVDVDCFKKVSEYFFRFPRFSLFSFSGFYLSGNNLSEINYNYSLFSGLKYIRRRPAFLQPSTFVSASVYTIISLKPSYKWMFDACFFYEISEQFNCFFAPERFSGHRLHGSNLTDVSNPSRTLEVASFYKQRYPNRWLLYIYLLLISFVQSSLRLLPRCIAKPVLKLLYLIVNTSSFLTAYLLPSI